MMTMSKWIGWRLSIAPGSVVYQRANLERDSYLVVTPILCVVRCRVVRTVCVRRTQRR